MKFQDFPIRRDCCFQQLHEDEPKCCCGRRATCFRLEWLVDLTQSAIRFCDDCAAEHDRKTLAAAMKRGHDRYEADDQAAELRRLMNKRAHESSPSHPVTPRSIL